LTASGCMRRTFLVRTTSRSGCSQLSQASATVLNPVRSRVAEVQRIVRSSPSLVQSQCLERKWAAEKYISCYNTAGCRRLGDRLCVIFHHRCHRFRAIGPPKNVILVHVGTSEVRRSGELNKVAGISRFKLSSRELVMLDCGLANAVRYAATTCMSQNTGFVGCTRGRFIATSGLCILTKSKAMYLVYQSIHVALWFRRRSLSSKRGFR
jgi:hypothetical protein